MKQLATANTPGKVHDIVLGAHKDYTQIQINSVGKMLGFQEKDIPEINNNGNFINPTQKFMDTYNGLGSNVSATTIFNKLKLEQLMYTQNELYKSPDKGYKKLMNEKAESHKYRPIKSEYDESLRGSKKYASMRTDLEEVVADTDSYGNTEELKFDVNTENTIRTSPDVLEYTFTDGTRYTGPITLPILKESGFIKNKDNIKELEKSMTNETFDFIEFKYDPKYPPSNFYMEKVIPTKEGESLRYKGYITAADINKYEKYENKLKAISENGELPAPVTINNTDYYYIGDIVSNKGYEKKPEFANFEINNKTVTPTVIDGTNYARASINVNGKSGSMFKPLNQTSTTAFEDVDEASDAYINDMLNSIYSHNYEAGTEFELLSTQRARHYLKMDENNKLIPMTYNKVKKINKGCPFTASEFISNIIKTNE
jgi:hypothetical protein